MRGTTSQVADGLSVGDVDGESVGESVGFGLRGMLQPSSVHPSAFHAGLLLGEREGLRVGLKASVVKQAEKC